MLVEFRDWTTWLFELVLVILVYKSILVEKKSYAMLVKEFEYDEAKDLEKKQRRTKTTRKTTTAPSGEITIEENVESVESKGNVHEETRETT